MGEAIRSIRTSVDIDDTLKAEAEKNGLSINAYLNKIINRHLDCQKLIDYFPCLIVPQEIIVGFINQLSDEQLIKQGKTAGSFLPKHSLFLKDLPLTLENVLKCMEILNGQYSNWYQFKCQEKNGTIKLLLRHQLGNKWSIYLNGYYTALFKELLNIEAKVIEGKQSIMIEIPKPNNNKI